MAHCRASFLSTFHPAALAADAKHGLLWVADVHTGTVRGFNLETYMQLPMRHAIEGFHSPRALAVDSRGLLHVSDANGYYIYEYVTDEFGLPVGFLRILEDAKFSAALAITEAPDGNILLANGTTIAVISPIEIAEHREGSPGI